MENNIKFKVTKNIGKDSEEIFGKVGTIYDTKDLGYFYDKDNDLWGGYFKTFEEFQKYLSERDNFQTKFELINDEKENENMKQFTKSDLKVGYLVRLANDDLCRLEQLKDEQIGFVNEEGGWVLTLYKKESDNYDENLKDISDSSYDINEVYGYSDSGYNLYKIKNRELLWKREEDMNFKKYEIKCADTEKNSIEANYNEGYKTKEDDKICLTTTSDYDDDFLISLSISNAKELIKSLQEIVDYVEGEDE